ncbi:MAG: hypothetical protein FWC82_01315 [Firmicutes bacterium]|nr:hypothetical protein [Bacillota bacterium]
MKLFSICLLTVCLVFFLYPRPVGVDNIRFEGEVTHFQNGAVRLSFEGGKEEMLQGLEDLYAAVLWKENFGDLIIFYAYSSRIRDFHMVLDRRINVMVALRDGKVSFGIPLLGGSF